MNETNMSAYEQLQVMRQHKFDMNLISQYDRYVELENKIAFADIGRALSETDTYNQRYIEDIRVWKQQIENFKMEHAGELGHLKHEYEYYKKMKNLERIVAENEKIRIAINDSSAKLKALFNKKCCIIPELQQKYSIDGMYYPFNIELKDTCKIGTEINSEEKEKIEKYTQVFLDGDFSVDIDKSEQRCIAIYYNSSFLSTYCCLFMTHGMYVFNPSDKKIIFIKYADIHSVRHEIIVSSAAQSGVGKSVTEFLSELHPTVGDAFNNMADMIQKKKAVIFINEIPLYVDNSMNEAEMETLCQFIDNLKSMVDGWGFYKCKHCHNRTVFFKNKYPGENGCSKAVEIPSKSIDDMTDSQVRCFSWNKMHSWERKMDKQRISVAECYLYDEAQYRKNNENSTTNNENNVEQAVNNNEKTSSDVQESIRTPVKTKRVTIFLAIFFGVIGAHRFYLGKWKTGLLYILFIWTGLTPIAGWIEAVIYARTPQEEFNIKYNKESIE